VTRAATSISSQETFGFRGLGRQRKKIAGEGGEESRGKTTKRGREGSREKRRKHLLLRVFEAIGIRQRLERMTDSEEMPFGPQALRPCRRIVHADGPEMENAASKILDRTGAWSVQDEMWLKKWEQRRRGAALSNKSLSIPVGPCA